MGTKTDFERLPRRRCSLIEDVVVVGYGVPRAKESWHCRVDSAITGVQTPSFEQRFKDKQRAFKSVNHQVCRARLPSFAFVGWPRYQRGDPLRCRWHTYRGGISSVATAAPLTAIR